MSAPATHQKQLQHVLDNNLDGTCVHLLICMQAYDPSDTGFMDTEILRSIFSNLGFGQLSDEDLTVLVEAADGDGDGKVSLGDFRGMCDSVGKREEAAEETSNQEEVDDPKEPS